MATEGASAIHTEEEDQLIKALQKWTNANSKDRKASLTDLEQLDTGKFNLRQNCRSSKLPAEKTPLASRHQQNTERQEKIKKITKEFLKRNRRHIKNHDKNNLSESDASIQKKLKAKPWKEEAQLDNEMDELLAALGYKVNSSDLADSCTKIEQVEESMGQVHCNPSDISTWLKTMLSEYNPPPDFDPAFPELPPPPLDESSLLAPAESYFFSIAPTGASVSVTRPVLVDSQENENELLNPIPESSRAQQQDIVLTITPSKITETIPQGNEAKSWKILQCVVVGGLFESITSLVIVTSAATTNIISNGNILALALANLISGFFVIRHDLWMTLKEEKLKQGNEMLRDAVHYIFHFAVAILSFILFGSVPPFVYAFTIGDKNLKLAIAAGVSLSCIALLAALKAHLRRPRHGTVISYVKTVASFMLFGVAAFVLSYLAGALFGKLIEKVDWFE